ncbi:MAG: methylenetetrahydrofolate--tRNA-(uracil(54)-C(5))-methyltransferase (FADH(2)-oxidizing) TrmFO [Candidatus Binataceae bacterium]
MHPATSAIATRKRTAGRGDFSITAIGQHWSILRKSGEFTSRRPHGTIQSFSAHLMANAQVTIIGAGLAGSEAAWQLARRGVRVRLIEMRPVRMTEAHRTAGFAELVCSNSLRSDSRETAVGVLKEEMRRLDSLVIAAADRARVPAGSALAVDRDDFSRAITEALETHPGVEVVRAEAAEIPAGVTIIASGPLTSPALGAALEQVIGPRSLYFYDAIAPIVTADSIDMEIVFRASRYGKGGDDYLNCPMTREQYEAFVAAVLAAEKMELHPFEKPVYFEGCMPIEEMARRGPDTLAFGPMRPVGLTDPRTGRRPFACVQLRQDDAAGRLYNIVGFQTKMTYPAQRRVLRTIPGLERAEFVRLGSLHRNTFIDSPRLLLPTLQLRARENLFLAGQTIGVEGYLESAAAGLLAGINAANLLAGRAPVVPPAETALGSLVAYITDSARRDFQPMNANYGLMPPLAGAARGREKKIEMGNRALAAMTGWIESDLPAGSSPAADSRLKSACEQ